MPEITDTQNPMGDSPFAASPPKKKFQIRLFNKISNKDTVVFTRSLAVLVNANVPLVRSLNILAEQAQNPELKKVISAIAEDVEAGSQLSMALSQHPKVFNRLYVNLVKTGEISGTLDKSLLFVADQLEKDYELRRKVRSAMVYPVFVISFMVIIMIVLFTFVMPKMLGVLQESNAELPFQTKILLAMTSFMTDFWWLVVLILLSIPIGLKMIKKNPRSKAWLDKFILSTPRIGTIVKNVYIERFTRNFAVLVKGGIPIVQGLKVTAEGMSNTVYENMLHDVAEDVENGRSLAESLAGYPKEVPALVTQMIDIGEQTSQIDDILLKIGTFYEREVDESVGSLTQLLEPIIIMVLGAMVAIIVSGILLPMYTVINTV